MKQSCLSNQKVAGQIDLQIFPPGLPTSLVSYSDMVKKVMTYLNQCGWNSVVSNLSTPITMWVLYLTHPQEQKSMFYLHFKVLTYDNTMMLSRCHITPMKPSALVWVLIRAEIGVAVFELYSGSVWQVLRRNCLTVRVSSQTSKFCKNELISAKIKPVEVSSQKSKCEAITAAYGNFTPIFFVQLVNN